MVTLIANLNGRTRFSIKASSCSTSKRSCRGPVVVSMAQNQSYWAVIESDITAYLTKAIPVKQPVLVFEPMHHLTFAAPQSMAPALCIAACELVGGDRSQAMAAASALQLMHAALYAHEHLQLTDRPRPKPTVQHKFAPGIELLTGDGIAPFGLELLAKSMDSAHNNSAQILRVIIEITRSVGSEGIIDGMNRALEQDQSVDDTEIIEYVCRKKEGELHACGAACGAILGGGAEKETEKLRKFGLYVGMIQGMGKSNLRFQGKIANMQRLALKELESFEEKKAEQISSLVEVSLSEVHA